ncbi:MAG TPA: nitrate/nitrite transporter NrtS [Myxococcota bacterium]|nr:nitrate/nitrite transporter NrtS [Myxococcota bacterium]
MGEWLRLASDGAVVRRALRTAVIVGSILIAINHGSALLHGDVDALRVFRMCLTVLVPYAVSTSSSVAALRSVQRTGEAKSSAQSPKRSSSA